MNAVSIQLFAPAAPRQAKEDSKPTSTALHCLPLHFFCQVQTCPSPANEGALAFASPLSYTNQSVVVAWLAASLRVVDQHQRGMAWISSLKKS